MGNQQADIQLMQMFPWFGMLRTQRDEASKMALAKYEQFQEAKNLLYYQVKNIWYQIYRLEAEIRIVEENLKILQTYEHLALIRFQSSGSGAGSSNSSNMQGNKSMDKNAVSSSNSSMGSMGGSVNTGAKSGMTSANDNSSMDASGTSMGAAKSGMSDVLRIRMELKDMENSLAQLKDSRIPLQVEMNQLLNRNLNESTITMDTLETIVLSIDRNALRDSITKNNPMLKMLDAEVLAMEAQKKMAKLEGRPMLGVGINYMPFSPRMDNGMAMGGEDMLMPMVKLSIPIYRKKYNAMQKEAELKQQALGFRRENAVNQLYTQWSAALRDLDDATRRTGFYKSQSDLAQQTLRILITSYSTDGSKFEDLLSVQQQLLNYQLKMITAIVDQHLAMALLENLTASSMN